MTIIYNLREINKKTNQENSTYYTNPDILCAHLNSEYHAMTSNEQSAAADDFENVTEHIFWSWDSELKTMDIGEQNVIPSLFSSKSRFFFVDVILHKQSATSEYNVLYDYYVTDLTGKDLIQRYLFDDVTDLHEMLLDNFYADDAINARIDRSKLDAAFVNIDTIHWKRAIAQISKDLDIEEIFTLSFDFSLDGNVHNVDVLVQGV